MRATQATDIRGSGRRHQSSPVYRDWADYFERAPRATDDSVAAIAERHRDLLPLEERYRSNRIDDTSMWYATPCWHVAELS